MNGLIDPDKEEKVFKKYYFFFLSVFITVLLFVAIRLATRIFVGDTFVTPTESMLPTLMPGDKVYAEKLTLGARIYDDLDSAVCSRNPEVWRIKGIGAIKRNDIVVFNFPVPYSWKKIEFDIRLAYCKRCIGLPGDTIRIVDGFFKNSSTQAPLGNIESQQRLAITPESDLAPGTKNAFPFDSVHYGWTIKNFGPLPIPKRGEKVVLDSINYILYRLPIEYETRQQLVLREGILCLGEKAIREYTFHENYYFTVGDNLMNSQDSRYWGFLPEKHIVGIVRFVLTSKDLKSDQIRWGRLFRVVN